MTWISIGEALWRTATGRRALLASKDPDGWEIWWNWRSWKLGIEWGRWDMGLAGFIDFDLGPLKITRRWPIR